MHSTVCCVATTTGSTPCAARIAGSTRDADDAAQEALIRIVRAIDRFDGRASFSTWSYRIATNAALDELRKRSRRPQLHVVGDDPATPVGRRAGRRSRPTPGRGGRRPHRASTPRSAELPEEFRVPVVMRDVGDLDYAEIAEALVGADRHGQVAHRPRPAECCSNDSGTATRATNVQRGKQRPAPTARSRRTSSHDPPTTHERPAHTRRAVSSERLPRRRARRRRRHGRRGRPRRHGRGRAPALAPRGDPRRRRGRTRTRATCAIAAALAEFDRMHQPAAPSTAGVAPTYTRWLAVAAAIAGARSTRRRDRHRLVARWRQRFRRASSRRRVGGHIRYRRRRPRRIRRRCSGPATPRRRNRRRLLASRNRPQAKHRQSRRRPAASARQNRPQRRPLRRRPLQRQMRFATPFDPGTPIADDAELGRIGRQLLDRVAAGRA